MIIDCKDYTNPCACGETHALTTQKAIIEAGCLRDFESILAEAGLTGARAAIYDANTYHLEGLPRPDAQQEIVLEASGLYPNEDAASTILQQLRSDTAVLVAIGSGTIHDLVRFCARRLGLPFVSCPTAASTDSFAGNCSSMRWQGQKTDLPGIAPTLVIADLDIISRAPRYLAYAGIGDALSNYTALADWRIACLLKDKPSCPAAESALLQSAVMAQGALEGIDAGDVAAYAQLMYALILPGLATQMLATAYPSSGAEHLLAYLLEMQPEMEMASPPVVHGELAGISTAIIAEQYHSLAGHDDISPFVRRYEMQNAAHLAANWHEIRRIIADIPSAESLADILSAIGARDILTLNIPEGRLPELLRVAPALRDQVTLARMVHMLHYGEDSSALASRASSRRSRYADSAITRAGSSSAVSGSSIR